MPRFSALAAHLTLLTRKGQPWTWTKRQQEAFEGLKKAMISATLLTTWNPEKETILEADASGYVVAGALLQRGDDNLLHAVAYYSRKMTPAEANYPIHDKEMLAIVSCIR